MHKGGVLIYVGVREGKGAVGGNGGGDREKARGFPPLGASSELAGMCAGASVGGVQ